MKTLFLTLLCVFLSFSVFSQNKKSVDIGKDVPASYVPPTYLSTEQGGFELSTGAFFFDATKRMGTYNVVKSADGDVQFKYLGEEDSDAIFETVKVFLGNLYSNKKGVNLDEGVYSLVEELVNELATKSNSLKFLKTSLYRLNESAYNEDIDAAEYAKLYEIIIKTSAELQRQELLNENNKQQFVEDN